MFKQINIFSSVDSVAPVVNCINDVSTTVQFGQTSTVVTFTEPTATDNSGVVNLVSRTHASGGTFPVGTTQVTFIFADGSNNIAQCTFNVIVTAGMASSVFLHLYIFCSLMSV